MFNQVVLIKHYNNYFELDTCWLSLSILLLNLGNFSSLPENERLANKELIVIVHSRPLAIQERMTVRESWGNHGIQRLRVLPLTII